MDHPTTGAQINPKKQECLGHYLYGAGYFARDENTLGLVTGNQSPPHFCLRCPKREECEDEHERRVRERLPEAAEKFDRLMAEARRRGVPSTLAAAVLSKRGLDPYALAAIENFNRGHADRGRQSGPLVG